MPIVRKAPTTMRRVERQGLLDPQHVISVARDAAQRGVTRFCMGAAWRQAPEGKDSTTSSKWCAAFQRSAWKYVAHWEC